MAKIIIIEDDPAIDILSDNFRYRGHEVIRFGTLSEADESIDTIINSDILFLDIIMPQTSDDITGSIDKSAGMKLYRKIRKLNDRIPIIVYSATQDMTIMQILSEDLATTFISKWSTPSIIDIVDIVNDKLGIKPTPPRPLAFIVHGHNETLKLSVKNYLQNTLNFPEPIILHEQPNIGRTIIEKFEEYAAKSCLVFVLLTPDDVIATTTDSNEAKRRARQNVIFEMGYFIGLLGRRSGRVILLHKGPLDLPSDLSGIAYINLTAGIEEASEQIRREIQHVI
jgi:CheY-like chemotaxis protein